MTDGDRAIAFPYLRQVCFPGRRSYRLARPLGLPLAQRAGQATSEALPTIPIAPRGQTGHDIAASRNPFQGNRAICPRYNGCLTDSWTGSCRHRSTPREAARPDTWIKSKNSGRHLVAPGSRIRRVHPPDRSWHNGPTIAHSGQDDRVPDISLSNKSLTCTIVATTYVLRSHLQDWDNRRPDRMSSGAPLAMARGLDYGSLSAPDTVWLRATCLMYMNLMEASQ